jgi:YbbR domain-containing protein
MPWLRWIVKNLPTMLVALVLAAVVWFSAVTASDPVKENDYPRPIRIEWIGINPSLVIVNQPPQQMTLKLSAPQSIWERLVNEQVPVRAVVDLSGLSPGQHTLPIQVQVGIRPVEIVSNSPTTVDVVLEALASRSLPVILIQRGEPYIGFQVQPARLSQETVTISGPASLVNKVQEVRCILDLNLAKEDVQRTLNLQAVDVVENNIEGITFIPERVTVTVPIVQLGGYRNVVVKAVITGQVSTGYRVTNISVFPPAVTLFSSDPQLINDLPGYVETLPLSLDEARDDLDISLQLNLPQGVSVVGDQKVQVQVGVADMEGSLTLRNMPVVVIGQSDGLSVVVSPGSVDVILSGPLPLLDILKTADVRVVVDVTGQLVGTYQLVPVVELKIAGLRIDSILPNSIEVIVSSGVTSTPTPTPTPNLTPTLTPSLTPKP